MILRELQGVRQVLDVQKLPGDIGQYQVQMAEGSGSSDVLQDKFVQTVECKIGANLSRRLRASSESGNQILAMQPMPVKDVATRE